MQGNPLRADWSSGKSGTCHNSVRDLRLLSLRYCRAVPVLHSPALALSF